MKRILLSCCIALLCVCFSGCTKVIELTDDENYIIAEYAAELLLKYDRNSDMKYYDDSADDTATPSEALSTTEALTEEAATTEVATTEAEADTESTTEEETAEAATEQSGNWTEISGVSADETSDFDIAEFAGVDNASIRYTYYMILDRYPSYDQDGVYMEVTAPAGYKLLVLKFDVENKTNESQSVDMIDKDVEYSIIVNDSRMASQMLTILIDDLYTYRAELDGSMRQEAVLLFQVSESIADEISDLKLRVDYNGDSRVIQLQ